MVFLMVLVLPSSFIELSGLSGDSFFASSLISLALSLSPLWFGKLRMTPRPPFF